MFTITTIFFT
nr:002 mRNA peptide [synthetic construct]AAA72693.1 003 mRNA peptide [synthetic construct]